MRFIANILTDRKFNDCEFYNVVSKKEDLIENIPTLVVGWGFTKELYPEANIINWEIGGNIFWTFNNREKGSRYEETLKKFNKLALNNFIKKIKYKYLSVFEDGDGCSSLEFLMENCTGFKVYINNNMIYVTGKSTPDISPYVYGFSIKEYEYKGIDTKKIFKKIYNSDIILIENKDIVSWSIRESLKNHTYAIPCLF